MTAGPRSLAAAALALALAAPAGADVSLVQIVQSQSGAGNDGLLAKSLIEVSGPKMRLVTALARKVKGGEGAAASPAGGAEPWRRVQVLDLGATSLLLIDPGAKTFEERGVAQLVYGPRADRPREALSVVASTVTVAAGGLLRRCLGAECSHLRVTVQLRLKDRKGRRLRGRLDQDLWIAPLTGETRDALLDVIAFENAFRRAAAPGLSPLDRLGYRIDEAAAHLGVSAADLAAVVGRVRAALADVPGYPLSSSVTWWREERSPKTKPEPGSEPRFLQAPPPAPPPARRPFVPVDWRASWIRLDRALAGAQGPGRFAFGALPARPAPAPQAYERFQAELVAVIRMLDRQGPGPEALDLRPEFRPKDLPERPAAKGRPKPPAAAKGRSYEIFTEIDEVAFVKSLPADRFLPPPGYRRRAAKASQ